MAPTVNMSDESSSLLAPTQSNNGQGAFTPPGCGIRSKAENNHAYSEGQRNSPEEYDETEGMDEHGEMENAYSYMHDSYDDNDSIVTDGMQSNRSIRNYGRHGTSKTHHKYNDGVFIGNDRGHMRIFKSVKGKSVPIEFYMSKYMPGTPIRNAISGIRENKCLVGKKEEGLFFKVSLAINDIGQDPYGTLFYTSPEEYERHFHATISQPIKEKWMERSMSVHNTLNNMTKLVR